MADLGNRTNVNAAIDTLLDDLAPNNSIQPSDHNGLLKDILDTLANGLSVALRTGNTTSGQNLQITSGDSIQFDNSTFLGSLVSGTLTGAQTYTLPDKSGTVAMTSDVSNILTANNIVMTGTYSHDLAGNTLTMDGGVINVTNGGFGVLGSGNVTSDGISNVLFSFIGSSGHQTLIVRDDNDSVAIGTSAADLSSVFEIASTTKGVLFPRMTTAKRDLIALPVESLLIYNTTTHQFEFRSSGATWDALGGGDNFANADLTLDVDRTHNLNGNTLTIRDNASDNDEVFKLGELFTGAATNAFLGAQLDLGTDLISLYSATSTNSGGVQGGLGLASDNSTRLWGKSNISLGVGSQTLGVGTEIYINNSAQRVLFRTGGTTFVNLDANSDMYFLPSLGNGIGIGTSTPVAKLTVNGDVILNGLNKIGSEDISLNGRTAVQGLDTLSTSTAFEVYDGDVTPNLKFEVRNNGDIYTNGNQGFTGTGAYTTLTIENGIITNAV